MSEEENKKGHSSGDIPLPQVQQVNFKEESGQIEESMAQGVASIISFVVDRSTTFKHDELVSIALLKDDPILGKYVRNYIDLKRHEKGWITKKIEDIWEPFVQAFQSIWYNKKVRNVLDKAKGKVKNLFWD